MTHFAKVVDGIVTRVIVAEPDFFSTSGFIDDSPGTWIQTYKDASQRGNYAGIGYKYDPELDAFIGKQPYPSWTLDANMVWIPPVALPADADTVSYIWDEAAQLWVAPE